MKEEEMSHACTERLKKLYWTYTTGVEITKTLTFSKSIYIITKIVFGKSASVHGLNRGHQDMYFSVATVEHLF